MDPAWIIALISLASLIGACGIWIMKTAWGLIGKAHQFFDDWSGEPARGGLPATPGVMARLQSLETSVNHVKDEMHPNGGNSMRDAVNQIRARIDQLEKQRIGREDQ